MKGEKNDDDNDVNDEDEIIEFENRKKEKKGEIIKKHNEKAVESCCGRHHEHWNSQSNMTYNVAY